MKKSKVLQIHTFGVFYYVKIYYIRDFQLKMVDNLYVKSGIILLGTKVLVHNLNAKTKD